MGIKTNVTLIDCDGPGCSEHRQNETAPDGWFRVSFAKHDKWDPSDCFVFHSEKCMERWAHDRRIALGGQSRRVATIASPELVPQTKNITDDELRREMMKLGLRDTESRATEQEYAADRVTLGILELFRSDTRAELTKPEVADLLGIERHGAGRSIDRLVQAGLLTITHMGANNRWDARRFQINHTALAAAVA